MSTSQEEPRAKYGWFAFSGIPVRFGRICGFARLFLAGGLRFFMDRPAAGGTSGVRRPLALGVAAHGGFSMQTTRRTPLKLPPNSADVNE